MSKKHDVILGALEIISEIFWGPSLERCAQMLEPEYLQRLAALAQVSSGKLSETAQQLESLLKSFPDRDSLHRHLEECYIRLFVSAKQGIAAPLYESCYEFEGAPLMGTAAAEMKERFEAKGLSVAENLQEPPDHLSIELEYVYFLLDKGRRERDDRLPVEASEFAADTMLPWVSVFEEKLARQEECRFYSLAARILVEVLHIIGEMGER